MTSKVITEREVLGMFYERLDQDVGMWVDAISTPVMESDQDSEKYAWLGMVPQMSQKYGEKQFAQMRDFEWTVDNVEYQGGIAFPEKHIRYDKTGQVLVRTNELADRTRAHWLSLIAPLIINGESTACYDGQYFFDTDHEEGSSGSQSNDINADISTFPVSNHGSTTAPSAGEMIHSIMLGVEQILQFKDDRGEYVNENMTDFLVLVPTSLLTEALSALSQQRVDGGTSNLLISQDSFNFRIETSPRLSSWTDKFAIFATQGQQAPFIRQQRIPNNTEANITEDGMAIETLWLDSEHCKKHDECLFSVETERAAAYGDWKKACLVTLT